MLLAKQQEAGKALMAEDEYWLDHSDDEEEDDEDREKAVNMCLMGKIESDAEADSENEEDEVCDLSYKDLMNKMHAMVLKQEELESNLKRESGVIINKNQLIQKLSDELAEKKVLVEVLHTNADTNAKEQTIILKENSELKSKLTKSEIDFYKLTEVHSLYTKENKTLIAKLDVLEKKLYSLGQSEQTIHLNKPKKNKENWGIGYVKPQRLQKGIREVPALYDYTSMLVSHRIASFKVFNTKLSEEDEANEFEKRMKSTKVHAPFYYAKLNNSYDYPNDEKKSLSTDYFQSYSEKEMEAKPVIGKIYVPSLVLESKIYELETSLSDERLMIEIQQKVFSTVMKNVVFTKASTSNDMFGSSNEEFNFLNSDGGLDGCFEQIDFNAKLPNHASFVKKTSRKTSLPVFSAKSTKAFVDKSVSVNAKSAKGKKISQHSQKPTPTGNSKKKHSVIAQRSNSPVLHVSDMSKSRPEAHSQWQPKRKLDKAVLSSSSINCNKTSLTKDVVIADIAVLNLKLAVSRKQYTMKQLFQLSLSVGKSSIYNKHVPITCQDSGDWFGNYHVHSSHTNSHAFKKNKGSNLKWIPKSCANTAGPKFQWVPKAKFVLQAHKD
ncbi:hypothetical protein L6452_36169 [Arctium lappa]|uniref:Uncharacterized protein n=1 Tax=Arctium lappa TaxID=4217 RepID=A0ACB8Y8E6_ARCLA|nr:hypothetical protein L6452_36169 [Arctium lappa]